MASHSHSHRRSTVDAAPDSGASLAEVQAHFAALTAQVEAAQTAPHMTYMGEVVQMLATVHTLLGAVLAHLGVPGAPPIVATPQDDSPTEGASHGNDAKPVE